MPHPPEDPDGILFLSDAHLGGFSDRRNRRIEEQLIRLLDYCEKHRHRICILGDLFDYWMEYPDRHFVPRLGQRLLRRFREFNDPDRPTLYITGNHDYWTGPHLPASGFDVEHSWRSLNLDGQSVLLLHGDGLPDPGMRVHRPLLHRLLRNKRFIRMYKTVFPPETGIRIMRLFSKFTRFLENGKYDPEVLDRWAERFLSDTDFDVAVSGHDHVPRIRNFDFGTYINLGTFCNHRTLCIYNNGRFSLVRWRDSEQELTAYQPESGHG